MSRLAEANPGRYIPTTSHRHDSGLTRATTTSAADAGRLRERRY
jgi:hypothetical protein